MATTAPVIEPHVESLDIAELVAHPANRELVADDLVDLTESLSSKLGLLQYPVVVPLADGGHRIIVGHSRIMSAQQLGWERIPCIVRDDLDDADELLALLEDNDRHRPLAVSDRARIDTELPLFPGYDTAEKIATATRRTREQVAGSLAVYRLGEAAWRAADADQLSLEDALDLEELRAVDPDAADQVLDKAGGGVGVRYLIVDAQRKRRKAEVVATTREELVAAGVRVLETPGRIPDGGTCVPVRWLRTADGGVLDEQEVKTRDGFGAIIEVDHHLQPRVTYVCLDPAAQGLYRTGSVDDPAVRASRAAQAAREEFLERLAIAAEVRLRWLRAQVSTQAKATAWLPDALRLLVIADCDLVPDDAADVLCAQPDRPVSATAKRITHRFVAYVLGASHAWACGPVTVERAAHLAQFYGLLRERGYELTEVEQQQYEHSLELVENE